MYRSVDSLGGQFRQLRQKTQMFNEAFLEQKHLQKSGSSEENWIEAAKKIYRKEIKELAPVEVWQIVRHHSEWFRFDHVSRAKKLKSSSTNDVDESVVES